MKSILDLGSEITQLVGHKYTRLGRNSECSMLLLHTSDDSKVDEEEVEPGDGVKRGISLALLYSYKPGVPNPLAQPSTSPLPVQSHLHKQRAQLHLSEWWTSRHAKLHFCKQQVHAPTTHANGATHMLILAHCSHRTMPSPHTRCHRHHHQSTKLERLGTAAISDSINSYLLSWNLTCDPDFLHLAQ